MVNYANGRVYNWIHSSGKCCIGSTTRSLADRKSEHLATAFRKSSDYGELYPFMRTTEPHEWTMVLIRNAPCESKEELLREEYKEVQAYAHQDNLLNVRRQYGVCPDSTRLKFSRPENVERLRALANAQRGLPRSAEHVANARRGVMAAGGKAVYDRAGMVVSWSEGKQAYRVYKGGRDIKTFGVIASGRRTARTREAARLLAQAWVDAAVAASEATR